MPWAANLEIKNINLNIVDNDHSVVSRRLVDKIRASTYFRLTALPATYDEALLGIEAGTADVILEIPYDFEKDWINGKAPRLLVAANAVNGTKGSLGGIVRKCPAGKIPYSNQASTKQMVSTTKPISQ